MKKRLLLLLAVPVLLFGCNKTKSCPYNDSAATASATEIAYIQAYLTNNSITAIQHSSGFFYSISIPGSGGISNLCSGVTVRYSGRTFTTTSTGAIFDSNGVGASFTLGDLIPGWQKGIPLVGKGGSIKLYVPPSLGYGAQAVGSIPANSYLVFDIQLDNIF